MTVLSPDTQATLLLVGRFSKNSAVKPLSLAEYHRLAKHLHQAGMRPRDLLNDRPDDLPTEPDRLAKLLGRGTALALAVERWAQLGIKVIGKGDEIYPERVKSKLRGAASPVFYVAGNLDLFAKGSICIVGSRDATAAGIDFASEMGALCAAEDKAVVSGDARGVDRAAMEAALKNGGDVVGVLADGLGKAVLAKRNRDPILSGHLLLASPYDPDSPFTVANAMDRNKYLYALADAAVVADSDVKGGTWNGAVENQKRGWTPAYVRLDRDCPAGNQRLAELGLLPLPAPRGGGARSLTELLGSAKATQGDLLSPVKGPAPSEDIPRQRDRFYAFFLAELRVLLSKRPRTFEEIENSLRIEHSQAKLWLGKAQQDGLIIVTDRGVGLPEQAASVQADLPSGEELPL